MRKVKRESPLKRVVHLDPRFSLEGAADDEAAIFFKFPPATHSGKKVIELKNISKSYGDNLVLHNLDFEMERGEKVGLVGVNGAGKSTMMKIITCFLPQSAGRASVCGFDVKESPMEVKKRVGYLPEHKDAVTRRGFKLGTNESFDKLEAHLAAL